MAEAGKCSGCGKKRPIHRALGTKRWCEDCSHLAPPSPEPSTKSPDDGRKRIKWTIGEDE